MTPHQPPLPPRTAHTYCPHYRIFILREQNTSTRPVPVQEHMPPLMPGTLIDHPRTANVHATHQLETHREPTFPTWAELRRVHCVGHHQSPAAISIEYTYQQPPQNMCRGLPVPVSTLTYKTAPAASLAPSTSTRPGIQQSLMSLPVNSVHLAQLFHNKWDVGRDICE